MTTRFKRLSMLAALAMFVAMLVPAAASADFGSTSELTAAMELTTGVIDATYTGDNAGASVETAAVAGFPVAGSSYLVLSTGEADDITLPDDAGNHSTNLGGPTGAAGQDQSQLAIRLSRPAGATCFAFDFRFFSEEYPEWLGSAFNDAFTAEIIDSDITFGNNGIITPWNFAYDAEGNPITINSVVGFADDTVTTFDGSTPLLTAITPAELNDDGEVLITLTIQDVGDSIFDSAVAIDNARWLYGQDCEAGVVGIGDRDEDGLPDDWEENGLDVDADGTIDLDLPALGADPDRKDIFLEIDWMFTAPTCMGGTCWGGVDFSPTPAAIAAVVAAFDNAPVANPDGTTGITLHVDAGPGSVMDPGSGTTWGALGRGNAVPHVADLGTTVGDNYQWAAFQAIKDDHFDDVRRDVFHYAIYADQYGGGSSSGISRGFTAADFIVSQGAFNGGAGFTLTQEQGTLMHEFGHNLDLRHGGDEHTNYKPHYLSIMSYHYQFPGLRVNGIDGTLDYSTDLLDPLNENSLNEGIGLGPDGVLAGFGARWTCGQSSQVVNNAAGPIDWDCDGNANETGVGADINPWFNSGTGLWVSTGQQTLTGHDDWANIRFDGGAIGQLGSSEPPPAETPNEELTLELAEAIGALTGDFDALLTTPPSALLLPGAGVRPLVGVDLANVGYADDTYTVAIDDGGLGVDPVGAVELAAGASTGLGLTVDTDQITPGTYQVEIEVTSGGSGAMVAAGEMEVWVPDLSDPDQLQAVLDALAALSALDPGEGPDGLDEILDMLNDILLDPRPALERARGLLDELDGDRHLTRAIGELDKALADRRWASDTELAPDGGSAVFAFLSQVVRDLERSSADAEVIAGVIDNIMVAAADVVATSRAQAEASGASATLLAEVDAAVAEAEALVAAGQVREALSAYQEAWDLLNET